MGELTAILTGVRIAGDPTFIPGSDPSKNHTIVTAMVNRKGRDGKDYSEDITVHFWNKNANVAANYLSKGKQCNIRGRLNSRTVDTGQVRADGKKILYRIVEVNATHVELLGDSLKEMQAVFDNYIISLKNSGRLDPNAQINFSEALPKKGPMIDFNPALSAQTGKYGHANVWSKDKGTWKPVAQAAPASNEAATIAALEAQIAALKKGTATVVDPFAVA
jgi:single-stranded DNA-binding protein